MARIAGELVIHRPVHEVFDFVADERNEHRYNPRIRRAEKLSPGPIGRGTRFRAEAVTLGRTTGMTVEYAAYERPRRLAPSIHMPAADIARVGRRQEQEKLGRAQAVLGSAGGTGARRLPDGVAAPADGHLIRSVR